MANENLVVVVANDEMTQHFKRNGGSAGCELTFHPFGLIGRLID
jgi:hypothetical protein